MLNLIQHNKKDFSRNHDHRRLLFQLHRLSAAVKGPIPAFGHNKLGATFLTHISLPDLIGHLTILLP